MDFKVGKKCDEDCKGIVEQMEKIGKEQKLTNKGADLVETKFSRAIGETGVGGFLDSAIKETKEVTKNIATKVRKNSKVK